MKKNVASLAACQFLVAALLPWCGSVASAQSVIADTVDIDKTTLPEGCAACIWNIADWFVASRDCGTSEGKTYLFLCRATCKSEGISTDLINQQIRACYTMGTTSVTQEQEFFNDK